LVVFGQMPALDKTYYAFNVYIEAKFKNSI